MWIGKRQLFILIPRGRDPFGQHQGSRPLAGSNTGSSRYTDSLSNLPNLTGWKYKPVLFTCSKNWVRLEDSMLGADQKDRRPWGQEWQLFGKRARWSMRRYPDPAVHSVAVTSFPFSLSTRWQYVKEKFLNKRFHFEERLQKLVFGKPSSSFMGGQKAFKKKVEIG